MPHLSNVFTILVCKRETVRKLSGIIGRIRAGDQKALQEVYEEHREAFIAWSLKNYRSEPEQAIEFYQMAILILYDNIVQGKLVELKGTIKTYLFAIGKNKWREYQRAKQKVLPESQIDITRLVVEPDVGVPDDSRVKLLSKSLMILGGNCKDLLEAFYYCAIDLDGIVSGFGYKNKDAAKTAKYKCLQRLKKIMVKELQAGRVT